MVSRIIYTIAAIILVSGIQFLAGGSGDSMLVIIAGALLCLIPYGLWMFIESQADSNLDLYLPGVAGITGISIGGLVRWIFQPSGAFGASLLAVALGALGCGAITILRLRQRAPQCQHCHRYLNDCYQLCPRCEQAVCSLPDCWNSEYYRCSDCDWLSRPLLPLDDNEWWVHRIGQRIENGTCLRCRQDADVCDLRKCGGCPWAMCVHCWDLENGRCVRCNWLIPRLPESLQAYLSSDEASVSRRS